MSSSFGNIKGRQSFSADNPAATADDTYVTEEQSEAVSLDMKFKPMPPRRRGFIESAVWVLASVAALVYGDGQRHFLKAVLYDPRVNKQALFVACLCLLVNACIFLYVVVLVRLLLRHNGHFDLVAPGATATSMLLGVAAFALFTVALWPIWGFIILPILWCFFMTLVVTVSLIPPFSTTKERVD